VPTIRDPFFANLASAVQQIATQKEYILLVLASHNDQLQETSELSFFRSYRVDGLLVVAPRSQSRRFLASLQALSVPIVALDRPLEFGCTSVLSDNYESSKCAVQHLIDHGRRRILCLGGAPDLYTILERVRGYEDAMRNANLNAILNLGAEPVQIAKTLKAAFGRKKDRPDAIYTLNGPACVQAYEFIMDNGIAMPSDVALLGFDDLPFASSLRPSVTTVRQPVDDLGTTAARVLFEQIETGVGSPRKIVLENSLVVRASCGCGSYPS
jgi:LacI family transcriptional regulator